MTRSPFSGRIYFLRGTGGVDWGWAHDVGTTMFHIIQAYTKGAQHKDLNAESSYKLQRTGGNILEMVN